MGPYSFHINLYDLAFLGAIFTALTFTALLAFSKHPDRSANRLLVCGLIIMIAWMVRAFYMHISLWDQPLFGGPVPIPLLLALGPFLFFYVRKLTRKQYRLARKDWQHFIPSIIGQVIFWFQVKESVVDGVPVYDTVVFHLVTPALSVLIYLSLMYYLHKCRHTIRDFHKNIEPVLMDRPTQEFEWLRHLLTATSILWTLWFLLASSGRLISYSQHGIQLYYFFWLLFAAVVVWTAASAYLQSRTPMISAVNVQRRSVPAEERAKGRGVSKEMETHRYYRDPELSLASLAEKMQLTPHELSHLLNTALRKNFADFINEYRVKDAARKISDPAYAHMTLLGIGFEAGFNSKTSFNRIFRELTGKSPMEYKKYCKKERPDYNMGRMAPSGLLILDAEPTRVLSSINSYYMFRNYFKTALRNVLRNKTYSFINVAGLATGLACTILIMLYVQDELSYDRFHHNAGQIYRIDKRNTKDDGRVSIGSYTGYFPGPRFAAKIPEIQHFVRFQPTQVDIKTGSEVSSQPASLVDTNFFSVFDFPLITGSAGSALHDPGSVVISEDLARKYFGSADAVGKTISIKNDSMFRPYLVTAVARNCPQNSSIKFDMLLPMSMHEINESNSGNWFNSFLSTFVVLTPGADISRVQTQMDRVFESDAGDAISEIKSKYGVKNIGISYLLEPLTSIHLGNTVTTENEILRDKSNPESSYILSAIAVFILLIACINFVNLTVARSVRRAKEIGIRKVIGGTARQLCIQFLCESFALCMVAFVLAWLLVILILPLFSQLSGKRLFVSYLFHGNILVGYVALFIITSLLAGFYPSVVLSNYNPVKALFGRFTLAGKNYLQKGLVIFQFALASFLIIASITIYRQFNFLSSQSLGYDDSDLITVNKPGLTQGEALLFKQELMSNPDIMDAAPKNGGEDNNTVKVNGGRQINAAIETVDANYLPLLKIPVIEGRNFSPEYPADATGTVLVNETFVKQAGWSQPLGQIITGFEKNEIFTVAGVVKDHHFKPLTEKITPQIFTMNSNGSLGMMYIKIRQGAVAGGLAHISKTFNRLFPLYPFTYSFRQEQNKQSYVEVARWKQILLCSALLTVFISCIGLFGLSVLAAEKRIKEIGVRKVLGASTANIVALLSGDFLQLVSLALVISMPLAWIVTNKWLQNYPYRIELNWTLFASGAALVILVAVATISFQSLKAAIANPVKSLRTD